MPHVQSVVSTDVPAADRQRVTDWATGRFADVMETGTGHVAVTVRDDAALRLGRADEAEPVALLNADVRAGRTAAQRECYAEAVIEALANHRDVPRGKAYVVYTEHPGEDFHLAEGPLASSSDEKAETGAESAHEAD
ncbi:MAG: phenylpyruvate tautomerase MIF-related protein [Haloarculaceae archaeon]